MTSLGLFIPKMGERALPFFKLRKRKEPFEWTPEADAAFQDLKRYFTSPPVMVASRPLEPLVLYLAATPHSASVALVALRKERLSKKPLQDAQPSSRVQHPQDNVPGASTDPAATEAPEGGPHEAMEDPRPHEERDSADASPLIEHPAYFVSTVPREARVRYPMP